eukprot:CAMPEP_0173418436 /NCGR_PEP_ID=MMETSP1357-20121228/591_1 /TAXON_ID=77926 /ORGANISM="Hemiselmis rufescens, Strain PCC563" /LENGTH=146 /DNA_ID=CAMNT_0014380925 /DNA_START=123 /DNA_END=563 /DNA_ORIENTATION=+
MANLPLRTAAIRLGDSCTKVAGGKRLYDRAGGAGTIDTCVEDFYDRLEDDDEIAKALVFRQSGLMSLESLKESKWNMMRFAFKGKPDKGPLRLVDLATQLNAEHWDTLIEHMQDTFEFLSLDEEIREEAMKNVEQLEPLFKKRSPK